MNQTKTEIKNAAKEILNQSLTDIQLHSEGAYSRVFKAKNNKTAEEIIIKVYYKNGFMRQEIRELDELRKYSGVPVPVIYGCRYGDEKTSDLFFMEHMRGVPVRWVEFADESEKEKIADAVVDAHIELHNNINPKGFGNLDCETYSKSWESLYKSRVDGYYKFLTELKDSPVTDKAKPFIEEAYYNFDAVFTQPVKDASLIYGDFKMKNILIDPKTFKLTAILDPMGCGYGDRESDLFPYINHPEDIKFGFLENYASKIRLSDKFPLKNMYYFLWNEIKLFVYMGYCMNDAYEEIGQNLHDMIKYGW